MWRSLSILVILTLGGCGLASQPPEAVLRLEFPSIPEMETAENAVQSELESLGFSTRGKNPLNLRTLEAANDGVFWTQRNSQFFWRHRERLLGREDVHAYLTPYPDPLVGYCGANACSGEPDKLLDLNYPFLELTFSQLKPGGFSPSVESLYDDLMQRLRELGGRVVVVADAPEDDELESLAITVMSTASASVGWLIIWGLFAGAMTTIPDWVFRRLGSPRLWRRVSLIFIGTVLATPVIVPFGFFSLPLPNALLLPAGAQPYSELWLEQGRWLPATFLASFGLSLFAAFTLIGRTDVKPSATA